MIPKRWILLALLAWALEFVVLWSLPQRGPVAFAIDNLGWAAIAGVSAVVTMVRARREREAATGWRLMGIGAAVLCLVSVLDAALVLRFGHLPLPPVLIAVLDNSTWVLFLAGLLAWTGQRDRRATIRAGLDGTLLAAALFLLAWWAGGSAVTAESNATLVRTIRSILPFALTCTCLGAIAYLGARSADRLMGPLGWLALGHLALLVGDLGYAWTTLRGTFQPGQPIDVLFQLPLFAFVLAPLSRFPVPTSPGSDDPGSWPGDLLTNLPAAAALGLGGLRYYSGIPADEVTRVCGAAVILLLLTRQLLTIWDVRRLSRTLEAKVIERTRALEESQAALVQAQRMEAIGRLAGGVAHDFNNVLTAIGGYVGLLEEALEPGHPARPDLHGINQAAESGSNLARRLMTLSRPATGSPQAVSPTLALARAGELARGLGRGRIRVTIQPGDAGMVLIDPVLLDQALTNLVANGIEAMARGGNLVLEAANHRLAEPNATGLPGGRYVRLSVSDTGSGMDEPTIARIFEPFFTTKGAGTGLGLSTTWAILAQAGGTVTVRSTIGVGTRSDILLPEQPVEALPQIRAPSRSAR